MNVKSLIYLLVSIILVTGLSIATLAFWQNKSEGEKYDKLTFYVYNISILSNTHTASLNFSAELHKVNLQQSQEAAKSIIGAHVSLIEKEFSKVTHLQELYETKQFTSHLAHIAQVINNIDVIVNSFPYRQKTIEALIDSNNELQVKVLQLQNMLSVKEEELHARIISDRDDYFFRLSMLTGIFLTLGIILTLIVVKQISKSQAEILARELRISTLVDTIDDGIIVIDVTGSIESMNPAAEMLFGYCSNEIEKKNIKMLMPEPFASAHDGYLKNYLTTGKRKMIGIGREVVGKRKDGTTFPMELSVSEMNVNGKHLFNGVVRDISERKETEFILKQKNIAIEEVAMFERTQSDAMALFSSSLNAELIFTEILSLLCENHGFAVSAVYLFDQSEKVLTCIASHNLPKGFDGEISPSSGVIGKVAKTGKPIILAPSDEIPFYIDTDLFTNESVSVVVTPIAYANQILGVLVLSNTHAITPSELGFIGRLSAQMGVSLNTLNHYHKMRALSEQLKESGEEILQKNNLLEKANQLKTEFLANMSHELRTPLNAIIGFSEILKDQMSGELNADQADYINDIFISAHHLLSLINDILDLSKIEAGKMELHLEQIELKTFLDNCLSVVKELAYKKNIQLALEVHENFEDLIVDARKLRQIIYNLLSNALKFTLEGGSVTMEAARVDDDIQFIVTDTGIGISADDMDKLFAPFVQIDGSLSRQYEGTGLGLALVKRLVECHGGDVNLTSVVGEGSCFSFKIPYRTSMEGALVS